MAIAVLVSSPAEAERFTAVGLDLASRLEQSLAVLCIRPSAQAEKKKGDEEKDSRSRNRSDRSAETRPPDPDHPWFQSGGSYAEATQSHLTRHLATLRYGFVHHEVIEVPACVDELKKWLVEEHESPQLGHFEIETLFIPMLRGAGVEHARNEKERLFEISQIETVYMIVEPGRSGRLPLNNIGVYGPGHDDLLCASRFARRLPNVRVTRLNREERNADQHCVIVSIAGSASRTRMDNHQYWNTLRKDASLPVAMIVNPADSRRERIGSAIDEKMRSWFRDYQMTREKRIELSARLESGAESSAEFVLFMAVATFLACIGLIQDSAAVIIGAMLVAPLMTPLLGAGLAMIYGNKPLFGKALRTISLGVAISFLIGTLVGLFSLLLPDYLFSGPGLLLTDEMIARSRPNVLDPFVGLAAGLAGGFAIGREGRIGTVAGVAIAAALVPPIATAGLEAALVIYCTFQQQDALLFFQLLGRDPGGILEAADLLGEEHLSTRNVQMVFAPLQLFVLNACATIIGAFTGLRMVGMHRTRRPRQSRRWVPVVFLALLLAVIVFLVVLPFITTT